MTACRPNPTGRRERRAAKTCAMPAVRLVTPTRGARAATDLQSRVAAAPGPLSSQVLRPTQAFLEVSFLFLLYSIHGTLARHATSCVGRVTKVGGHGLQPAQSIAQT